MEKEWVKFGKKYNKIVDKNALFYHFARPLKEKMIFGRMLTDVAGHIIIYDADLVKIKTKKELKEYARVKKIFFIINFRDFLEDSLEEIKIMETELIGENDEFKEGKCLNQKMQLKEKNSL